MDGALLRGLDDPSLRGGAATLLTLPASDFPGGGGGGGGSGGAGGTDGAGHGGGLGGGTDGLVLIRLSSSSDGGGLALDDLLAGAYVLGDDGDGGGEGGGGAARLVVERGNGETGKTLELTRAETSNTYVVVPPAPLRSANGGEPSAADDGKSNGDGGDDEEAEGPAKRRKTMATMAARSVGKVPGEASPPCFFLDPSPLPPGHFAPAMREALGRWSYDPLDPPRTEEGEGTFGHTVAELAQICRTSRSEIRNAIRTRTFGAEDAMAIPLSAAGDGASTRYGVLSEEGRQTVSSAIVETLLETDLDLAWHAEGSEAGGEAGEGAAVSSLMEEVRARWHRSEGDDEGAPRAGDGDGGSGDAAPTDSESPSESQSQFGAPSQLPTSGSPTPRLADEAIWRCLRPVLRRPNASGDWDVVPAKAKLIPDEVARLAAHQTFLRAVPRSLAAASSRYGVPARGGDARWDEEELLEAWTARLPHVPGGYEPRAELLGGVAIAEDARGADDGGSGEERGKEGERKRKWRYLPESGLPAEPARRIRSLFAVRDAWTAEEAAPYLARFAPGETEERSAANTTRLLERHARATRREGTTAYVSRPR